MLTSIKSSLLSLTPADGAITYMLFWLGVMTFFLYEYVERKKVTLFAVLEALAAGLFCAFLGLMWSRLGGDMMNIAFGLSTCLSIASLVTLVPETHSKLALLLCLFLLCASAAVVLLVPRRLVFHEIGYGSLVGFAGASSYLYRRRRRIRGPCDTPSRHTEAESS